jgi:hypothetical protein
MHLCISNTTVFINWIRVYILPTIVFHTCKLKYPLIRCGCMLFFLFVGPIDKVLAQQSDAQQKRAFDNLLPGMTMAKVRETIGNPTRVEHFKLLHLQTGDTSICWYYGTNGWTIFFRNTFLDRIEKNRDQMLLKIQQWSDPKNTDGIQLIYEK